ncbi:MAG: serine hydrolase [Arachidicoccus sp.]|nr:serine hydrolase [Arachidicoccus sp.]
MGKNVYLFILILFITNVNAQKKGINNLGQVKFDYPNMNLEDTIYKYTNFYPNGTQLAITLIENGKVKFFRGILKQNDTLKDVVNKDFVFGIGSITKVFTSTLLARSVINHQVSLDETVDKILGYSLKDNTQITLKELSNHTSGLPRLSSKIWSIVVRGSDEPYANFSEQDLKTDLTDSLQLQSAPGTKYAYSNFGAGLLAYSLSKVEKKPYEEMLQQQIFEPLKMRHSTTNRNKIKNILIEGLNANGDTAKLWDFSEIYKGCGSIYSSVSDLSKFVIDNFNQNKINTLLHQPTFQINSVNSVALGWNKNVIPSHTYYWHNGGVEGYRSCLIMDIEKKNAIIILSNVSGLHPKNDMIDVLCFELFKAIDK